MKRIVAVLAAVLSVGAASAAVAFESVGPATALTSVAAVSAVSTTPAWRTADAIPGYADHADGEIDSVSCGAAGNCAAGGYYTDSSDRYQAFVANEVNGVWRSAIQVPGLSSINTGGRATVMSVSCASAGDCSAGGYYTLPTSAPISANGNFQAFVVNETGGRWGAAQLVPGLAALDTERGPDQVWSLSCTEPGDCSAGGSYTPTAVGDGDNAFVVTETNGRWGTAEALPGLAALRSYPSAQVVSVSCSSPGYCGVAGDYGGFLGRTQPFVATETGGFWGDAAAVAGLSAISPDNGENQAVALSCTAQGDCSLAGNGSATGGYNWPFVVSETGGTWGTAEPVPGLSKVDPDHEADLTSISCGADGNCAAGGSYTYAVVNRADLQQAFVLSEVDGTWQTLHPVPGLPGLRQQDSSEVSAVSCINAGSCSAVGGFYEGTANKGFAFAIDQSDGSWGPSHTIMAGSLGAFILFNSLSCVTGHSCAAGGFDDDSGAGVIAERTVPQTTRTALSLSTARVTYGDERAERVTVRVTGSGWTPAGTVTIKSGATVACTVSVTAGTGSCLVPAAKFAPGRVSLTASYGGAPWFIPSASAAKSFTVVKAATTTKLSLSASQVTYGSEGSEHLTVTVTPRYSGTLDGTVTIRAGRAFVAAITLSSAHGSCTLTAKQLKAGTYHLIAYWPANADFYASMSAAETLTVVK